MNNLLCETIHDFYFFSFCSYIAPLHLPPCQKNLFLLYYNLLIVILVGSLILFDLLSNQKNPSSASTPNGTAQPEVKQVFQISIRLLIEQETHAYC